MALKPLVLMICVGAGALIGWYCGGFGGLMGAYLCGVLGASCGLYIGRKLQRKLRD